MAKQSIKGAVQQAVRDEKKAVAGHPTYDSFVNFAHKLGVGADNILSSSSYGFNPITRDRMKLEWIHRGSWLGGLAVDVVADDMTRKGIEYVTELDPDSASRLDMYATALHTWEHINECIRWARLYGGCIAVVLIDGHNSKDPLRIDAVGPGSYKGLLVLDRWMVEPILDDLVTELGPHLGLPRYYRVQSNAPALRSQLIHYTRVALRLVGVPLPYNQQLTENLWGISVLERLYDRMIGFDAATTGASQLVNKAYLRTLSVDGLREIVSSGGKALEGLISYTDMMRRFQGIEGITLLDVKDKFEVQSGQAFSGISDVLVQLGQQLSGALQIPLVRLFGQSPTGLNSTGESDLRMYYDHISNQQDRHLYHGVHLIYRLMAAGADVKLPPNFALAFSSLRDLSDTEKADLSSKVVEAVTKAHDSSLISDRAAMQELRQSSRTTGIFTNITPEQIEAADDQITPPPEAGGLLDGMGGFTGQPPEGQDDGSEEVRPNGEAQPVQQSPRRRVVVQQPTPGGSKAG
jgi:hypothetical protein